MKAREILEFFLSRAPFVDRAQTVDRIIRGDPEKETHSVLVTWMPNLAAVRAAIDGGYDLLLAHEPTFYDHRDYRGREGEIDQVPVAAEKRRLIDDAGLVVMRIHDVWDLIPDVGIPFAWARFLGFREPPVAIAGGNYMHRYDMQPTPFGEFARQVLARVTGLGENGIQVYGPADALVSRVGIGTGCATDPATFQAMGCDVSIVSDDGTAYWRQLQRCEDEGHPFLRVHHGTSEEPGMVTLTQYLQKHLPRLDVKYRPHRPFHRTLTLGPTP